MTKPSEDTGTIARSAGKVSLAVMCSRVLGLVREQVMAAFFGAGPAYDAFVVAFRIPNLLRDLFGEGALSAAFVAVFTDYDANKSEKATWQLAGNVLVFIGILLSVITLLGIVFSEQVVRLLVEAKFENHPGQVELTQQLTVIMFPFLLFISLSSVVMGILNTKGRFFIPAMASSFFNLGSIIGGVSLALILPRFGQPAIAGMAIGTLIGGLLQLLGQLPSLKRSGFQFMPQLNLKDPGLQRILRLMVPAIIGLAPLQVNVLVNNYFASSLAAGSLSWLSYAFRLFWLPVGLFGVALSTAAMPVISRHAALKHMDNLRETFVSSLVMGFCLTIPSTVGLIYLAEPITRVIFQHGNFTAFDVLKTSEALCFYAIGLFAYASVKIMVPVFYALDDTKYPVVGSFLTMAFNVMVIFLTIDAFAHKALALSISCATMLNFLFLSLALYRKLGGYSIKSLLKGAGKVGASSGAMLVWLYILDALLSSFAWEGMFWQLGRLLLTICSAAGIYGVVLHLLKVSEMQVLIEKMHKKIAG